ncbi:hypothetical protein NC797_04320 [Aquibacillus sp. 3ASR75-11]|uniref:Peptidyl-prolyl cis-trans isomerase n=1 Tax=Terrihalobacillus insolitus TaxID=2950438 RepID=A0A9X3WPH2_9BACI|nr:hypothetical protein [Terrihalobacillus insolitus]MDC3412791.1 hypothetical protein [Terrihalobacillus insolitus]MDC3423732.1 hypothetical protein [Terrihalobacillus insolitus]
MIVQLTGKVNYPITLDPTVWIFDDRKIPFDELTQSIEKKENKVDEADQTALRLDREVFQQKINPPVNKSISKFEREKILKGTYVMPIHDFIQTAEIKSDAAIAKIITDTSNETISLKKLEQSYLLFSVDGKPVKDKGPVHLYVMDESDLSEPIKGVKKIVID